MGNALEVGKKLVELCRKGKSMEAIESLYSPNVVSIEAEENPAVPRRTEGFAKVKGKTEWWEQNHEIHSGQADGPWPHGDRFIVHFKFDITAKTGPMAGKRMNLEEAALYTVKDGKIVQEEFFYSMAA